MLIEILKHIQARDNLTDQEFADKIGIHRVSWNRIKRGTIFGRKFLSGVRQAYPELKDAIDIFLCGEVANDDKVVTTITTSPAEPSQNGKIARFRAWLKGFIPWVKRSISKQATKSKSRGEP